MLSFPMGLDEIIPAALNLPVHERAALAASLWESLADPFQHIEDLDDQETLALAAARDQELESGVVAAVSHAELMQRLGRGG